MKRRSFTVTLLAAVLVAFGFGASAQRSPGNKTQGKSTTQGQTNSGMMSGGMMGQGSGQGQGMMGGGMMAQMTTHHEQMSLLMNKLMQSMAEIQSEKDPKALKSKLADHLALLGQMRSQMMQQGNMMQMMSGQMKQSCPLATEMTNPPTE